MKLFPTSDMSVVNYYCQLMFEVETPLPVSKDKWKDLKLLYVMIILLSVN